MSDSEVETYEIDMSEFVGEAGYIRDYFQMQWIEELVLPWVREGLLLRLNFTNVEYVGKFYRGRFRAWVQAYPLELIDPPWER